MLVPLMYLIVSAAALAPQEQPVPQTAAPAPAPAPPLLLSVSYLPPKGAPPDRANPADIEARIAETLQSAAQAKDALAIARLRTSAANRILSFRLARPATALLLGLARDEDLRALAESSAQAANLLDAAAETLKAPGAVRPEEEQDAEQVRRFASMLSTFADALRAAADPPADRAQIRKTLSRLGILLESDDAALSASAALWYARLARHEEDWDSALKTLPAALSEPEPTLMPLSFFLRLERCRLGSLKGDYSASLALLMRIEDGCTNWFDDNEVDAARRCAVLMQLDVVRRWKNQLDRASKAEESRWCMEHISRMEAESLSDPHAAVLQLTEAVPFMMGKE
ncbi:MAG: hypothetical protein IT449_17285 [Phycisphaerales bacterium]|nr:hypothetical protein [Phycisphaerales bacterium]